MTFLILFSWYSWVSLLNGMIFAFFKKSYYPKQNWEFHVFNLLTVTESYNASVTKLFKASFLGHNLLLNF